MNVIRSICGVEIPKHFSSLASSRNFVNNSKLNISNPKITPPVANFSLACCKRGKKHLIVQGVFSRSSKTNISFKSPLCTRSSTSLYNVGYLRRNPVMHYAEMQSLYCPRKTQFPKIISISLFHTSSTRMVPPLIFMIAKTAAKMLAIITGRGFRKWWYALPPNKKSYFVEMIRNNNGKVIAFVILSTLLFIAYYESHVHEVPLTGRRRYIAFTKSQFDEIADFEFKMQCELYKSEFLPTTHPHYERVSRVTERLLKPVANMGCVKNKKFSIAVLKNNEENAFVLPQGQIFVFEGILDACKNDDQLAVIMAHEMAHCLLGHAAENLSFAHLIDFMVIAILAALWAVLPSDGVAIVTQWFFHKVVDIWLHLPFSRKLETEADEVGLRLAAKACFDVRESSAFWARMSVKNDDEEEHIEWLSTHPSHSNRSTHLDSLMDEALAIRKQCGCTELPSQDPRKIIELIKVKQQLQKEILNENRFIHVMPK